MGASWHGNESSHWVLQKLLKKNGDLHVLKKNYDNYIITLSVSGNVVIIQNYWCVPKM